MQMNIAYTKKAIKQRKLITQKLKQNTKLKPRILAPTHTFTTTIALVFFPTKHNADFSTAKIRIVQFLNTQFCSLTIIETARYHKMRSLSSYNDI